MHKLKFECSIFPFDVAFTRAFGFRNVVVDGDKIENRERHENNADH